MPRRRKQLGVSMLARLKVLANLNIAERRLPQDGRIKLNLGGRAVDLRVSTLPTQFGESVVLRVLDQSSVQLKLRQLGLPDVICTRVEEVLRPCRSRPAGPAGGGI